MKKTWRTSEEKDRKDTRNKGRNNRWLKKQKHRTDRRENKKDIWAEYLN